MTNEVELLQAAVAGINGIQVGLGICGALLAWTLFCLALPRR